MAIALILLLLFCFGSAAVHVCLEGHVIEPEPEPEPDLAPVLVRRSSVQLGAVTCDVVEFEDFELIKTSEQVLAAAGW